MIADEGKTLEELEILYDDMHRGIKTLIDEVKADIEEWGSEVRSEKEYSDGFRAGEIYASSTIFRKLVMINEAIELGRLGKKYGRSI